MWASTTWLMTVSHVMDVFLRMMWLGDGAGPLPVFRSRILKSECSRLWSAACAQGLVTAKDEDIRGTKRALEQFAQQVRGSAEFEAKQTAARNMFSVQAELLMPDAEAATADVCRVKSVEDTRMDHLVEVGTTMAMVADLWEFIGPPGDDARKVSGTE